jgi:hypothetical protein
MKIFMYNKSINDNFIKEIIKIFREAYIDFWVKLEKIVGSDNVVRKITGDAEHEC